MLTKAVTIAELAVQQADEAAIEAKIEVEVAQAEATASRPLAEVEAGAAAAGARARAGLLAEAVIPKPPSHNYASHSHRAQ